MSDHYLAMVELRRVERMFRGTLIDLVQRLVNEPDVNQSPHLLALSMCAVCSGEVIPVGTRVRNRRTGAVMRVAEDGIWLRRFYEESPEVD